MDAAVDAALADAVFVVSDCVRISVGVVVSEVPLVSAGLSDCDVVFVESVTLSHEDDSRTGEGGRRAGGEGGEEGGEEWGREVDERQEGGGGGGADEDEQKAEDEEEEEGTTEGED